MSDDLLPIQLQWCLVHFESKFELYCIGRLLSLVDY